ncbi:DUF4097 family beta strand repeat-containing protein [Actinomadura rugatobispora]|uniref:DUF4097 family beta strand repeat-containing protein n=1 Tax=Actinomadura rugatobispora TaxID=1994 RepID=A0ABW0ZP33_9ACTN
MAVATVAAALAAAVTGGCSVSFNTKTHRETRSHTLTGTFPELRVHGDSGRLEVVGTDSPRVKVVEYLSWSNPNNKPRTVRAVRDGTLTLETKCSRTVIGYNACGAGYRVEVPRSTTVDLRTDSGSLRVDGLTGSVMKLHSDSGSVNAENVRADSLSATANSGKVKVSGRADSAELRSDSGAIEADGLQAKRVTARANSGGVRLHLASVPDSVDIDNDSGSVKVLLPTVDKGYAFILRTDSGARNISPALRQDSSSPHRVRISNDSGAINISPAPEA